MSAERIYSPHLKAALTNLRPDFAGLPLRHACTDLACRYQLCRPDLRCMTCNVSQAVAVQLLLHVHISGVTAPFNAEGSITVNTAGHEN